MIRPKALTALAFLISLRCLSSVALGADIHGSARVYFGTTDQNGEPFDQLDQRYRLNLRQVLTPFLSLDFDYRFNDLKTQSTDLDFGRRNYGPLFALIYQRPGWSGRLSYEERKTRGTDSSDNFDLRSLLAVLRWRPRVGPSYSVSFRDDTNVADVAIFGRDVNSKSFEFSTDYSRTRWNARYALRTATVDNPTADYRLDEDRHDLIAGYNQSFWKDRLALTADTRVSRRHQTELFSDGETRVAPVVPVQVRRGLFAVDTTPEIGELDNAPGLIDGDLQSPVEPPIDIGGANTFRNVGVNLGFTRQISQLEISIDSLSGPDVIWEVYQSPDNLTWTRVLGVTSELDNGLLRYNLHFPLSADRFFKAVNVTVNSFSTVRVTELRALVDVGELESGESLATTLRADFSANVKPHQRVHATLRFGLSDEDALARGLLSRDLYETNASAVVRVTAAETLDVILRYGFSSLDDPLGPVLQRDVKEWSAALEYNPIPTVNGLLTISQRDELDQDRLIQSAETVRGRLLTELLPNLSLLSELVWTAFDNPFSNFRYTSRQWRETLQSRLTESFQLGGSLSLTYYDSGGVFSLTRRTRVELRAIWNITPFLAFTGDWNYAEDDNQKTYMPRFNVSWTPGTKLRVTVSYLDTDTRELRRTTTLGATADYRINPRLTPFAVFSRSTFDQVGLERSATTTLRFGFNFFF